MNVKVNSRVYKIFIFDEFVQIEAVIEGSKNIELQTSDDIFVPIDQLGPGGKREKQ